MKAPDKLEMTLCAFSDIGLCDIEEEGVEFFEYVRKDTLLRWLKEKASLAGVLKKEAYQSVIDKLNHF